MPPMISVNCTSTYAAVTARIENNNCNTIDASGSTTTTIQCVDDLALVAM